MAQRGGLTQHNESLVRRLETSTERKAQDVVCSEHKGQARSREAAL